ncbi:hypothetical protein llap_15956 [Limosa lapponica baueri]|uniref:Uncharacterized protein n=1 Tax=Limosa lapponica baueri TaxID=1758121 RepID=A0A2I0TIT6_LIMLA|nr:hypothetical protein llap_15956 [Limosa lapponica baueri]
MTGCSSLDKAIEPAELKPPCSFATIFIQKPDEHLETAALLPCPVTGDVRPVIAIATAEDETWKRTAKESRMDYSSG